MSQEIYYRLPAAQFLFYYDDFISAARIGWQKAGDHDAIRAMIIDAGMRHDFRLRAASPKPPHLMVVASMYYRASASGF